ncbi:hypothetical protein HBI56_113140 [Parastagonospora nodorum]|uniref:Uncharacterized protein n=1 Tax=Phaeosphaeria nodorum (strain SN15 / ATCC MYA-4574 / FGSC 10173) TaxID=321614 RepID=A0A7U2FCE3_PHANO|nr:hypothetical protein HBH56_193980 [Parastagonospora nodorum]QRD00416.1 hypothetical protein JI435_089840 [Parastagonospora nodorum SN15]KAH3924787.1 hypothetical protein HBH54_189540 [Parastagonospora nodorum]KAH3952886.1 hypothetical protein HBH53_041670 [Parastagonospora nodorum]KAH3976308.1 hypothetical protein HBH52_116850 [Parastagonospora nodorum]
MDSKLRWRSQSVDLSYLIDHARNTESSNQKGKVCAFLGLSHTHHDIHISYDKAYSMNALLADTARSILVNEMHGVDMLLQAGTAAPNRRLTPNDDALPSWAPDWTIPEDPLHHAFLSALALPLTSAAGLQRAVNPFFLPDSHGNENRILVLSGVKIATLRAVLQDKTTQSWRTFSTDSERFTVTSTAIGRQGDEVWIFDGVKWPLLMRQEYGGTRVLLAPAMVHESQGMAVPGVMFGKDWEREWRREALQIV